MRKVLLAFVLAALTCQTADAGFLRSVGKRVVKVAKVVASAVW